MPSYKNLWDPLHLDSGQTLDVQLGALHLRAYREKSEWYIGHEYNNSVDALAALSITSTDQTQPLPYTRWILQDNINQIQLKPQLPDRPIIVRPEMPVCLEPRQSARFFVGIPIWLKITFGPHQKDLVEIPTMTLSNSWFGSVTEGELCYALKTTAKRNIEALFPAANRVVFPLEIRNLSDEMLNFERLCLRGQHLNIYKGKMRLYSSTGRISYRGAEKWSRLTFSKKPPAIDHATRLLSRARTPLQRGLILNTFDTIKK